MKFRYDTSGYWLKGNTHIHSTASDGGKTFSEIAELYAAHGYDFLFRTDHWVCSDIEADQEQYPLLWLDGIELDGKDDTGAWFHVACLGRVEDLKREDGFVKGLESARNQGALLIAAHPHWCGNTLADCLRWPFDGVEIYNHVCHWLNGKSSGLVHWDAMMKKKPGTLAFAADDAHLKPGEQGANGGWIVVNVKDSTREKITKAIRRGNFYSSCGPEIKSLSYHEGQVSITTSPVRYIRMVGPGSSGSRIDAHDGPPLIEATMEVPKDWDYVYIELEDDAGRRAWTNNLFTEI